MVAFPLLIVFGSLFASADVVFRDLVTQVFAVDFHALLSHTFLITVFATLAAGYFRGALLRRGSSREEESAFSIGLVPVATALGLVDTLFLIFVVIQLRYMFGGAQLIATSTGLTYAEYARRGWRMFPSIGRVYVDTRARTDLGWTPRHDFRTVLDSLKSGEDPRSPLARTIGVKG